MIKKTFCTYYFYEDYYETDCSNQLEEEEFTNLDATYCPFFCFLIEIECEN